jgi:ketosteroid isomerase-like protein
MSFVHRNIFTKLPSKNAEGAGLADEEQIRRLMDEWRRLTAEGDVDGLLSLATGVVVFLTPGKPSDHERGLRRRRVWNRTLDTNRQGALRGS